jgi:parallel beta-helix repeat protein
MKNRRLFQLFSAALCAAIALLPVADRAVLAAPEAELHVCPSGCAYSTIQTAVDAAAEGAVIKIAAGSYSGVWTKTGGTNFNQVVYLTKAVTLDGGYTPANWTAPDPVANVTTIDAQGQGRVLYISLHAQAVTLRGLHLVNGDGIKGGGFTSTGASVNAFGNKYEAYDSAITLVDCVISGNTTDRSAAGLSLTGLNVTMTGNKIENNTIHDTGGNGVNGAGLLLSSTNAVLTANQFLNNSVPIGAYYGDSGGGLHASYSTVTLTNNIFQGNQAQEGGGLSALISTMTLTDNRFLSNTAANGGGLYTSGGSDPLASITLIGNTFSGNTASDDGGGAWIGGRQATVLRNVFDQNTSESDGGGLVANAMIMTIDHNTFSGNTASFNGGGLYMVLSPELRGNVISGNSANRGGGISINGNGNTHATLANNVIVDNQVENRGTDPNYAGRGSGVYVEGSAADLIHTTLARNTGGDGSSIYVTNYNSTVSSLTLTNTILANSTIGLRLISGNQAEIERILWSEVTTHYALPATPTYTDEFEGDPLFGPDGYHLLEGSVAIGNGTSTPVTTDIDNQPRPNRNKSVSLPDLGADEFYSADQIPRALYLPMIVR